MTRLAGGLATFLTLTLVAATAVTQQAGREPTLEERVALLEMRLASLDSRFELTRGLDDTSGDRFSVATRVAELERSLDRLATAVQRAERQADTALREATQARRDAMTAQQLARDAANRLR